VDEDMIRYLSILLLLFSFSLISEEPRFQWPLQKEKYGERLTSLFGESRRDHFHNGLDLSSLGDDVRPVSSGKILYSKFSEDDPFQEDWGAGNNVWINHGKGYFSSYYHLSSGRKKVLYGYSDVSLDTTLGVTGNTGHSGGAHLHFVVTKDYGKTILDPLSLLPPTEDNTPPIFGELTLYIGDRIFYLKNKEKIRLSSQFPVTVEIIDSSGKKGQKRGIQYLKITINGKVFREGRFRKISYIDGKWKNEDGFSFNDLFYKDSYSLGTPNFKDGWNTIQLEASDFHSNTATKLVQFQVERTESLR
jgi:hypothetical protein